MRAYIRGLSLGVASALCAAALSQTKQTNDYTNLSLEDLMKIQVTSASKHAQALDTAACAITVITQDDIHRSGVRNLAEALRLAPGVQVQELSEHYYAITIRGFDNRNFDDSFGDKLLVLIDGRSIYSPYASTVYWEVEDLMLEDVDRIEVIRGPGGTLYGANAVNGVINIITKKATNTLGALAVGSLGSLEKDRLAFRYGFPMGKDAAVRFFGKVGTDGTSENPDGSSVGDGGSLAEMGFRADADTKAGSFMADGAFNQFGIYESQINPTLLPPYSSLAYQKDLITTSHLLGRWNLTEKGGAEDSVLAYYDLLDYPYSSGGSTGTTWDLEVQRAVALWAGNELTAGGSYRYEINDSTPGVSQNLVPARRRDTIASIFAQDEVSIRDRARVTFGAKLEHNTFTGYEFEPSIRYWQPTGENQSMWAAVSRAVRTPSQSELNDHLLTASTPPAGQGDLPTAYVSFGNPNLTSEVLVSNEIGYRIRPTQRLSFDGAAFYNLYSNLIYQVAGVPFESVQFGTAADVIPMYLANGEHGNVYGGELESRWSLARTTNLTLTYSYVGQTRFSQGTSIDAPMHQVGARLSNDFSKDLKLDAMTYWYSAIPSLGASSYVKLDLNLGWTFAPGKELSIAGDDLLYARHSTFAGYYDIPSSVYAKFTWRF